MQHRYFLFLIPSFLFIIFPAKAQVGEYRSDLAVGVSGGYVMNRMDFSPSIKQDWKPGMTLGLTARYTCERYFTAICAVQAELNYANLGWKENIEPEYSTDTYSRDMHYVQLPVFARMAWGRERKGLQFFILAGPQLNFFLAQTEHYSSPFNGLPRPNSVNMQYGKDVENRFEYGITGGAGLELSTAIGHFQLEGRYYFGLSDIWSNSKKDPFGRSANGAIYIRMSYLMDLIRTKDDSIR